MQIDGHLGPRTWRDPKTGTMLWLLAGLIVAAAVLPTFIIAAIYVAVRAG